MITRNSYITLILAAIVCIGFGLYFHHCRPVEDHPSDSIQDSITYYTHELREIRKDIDQAQKSLSELDSAFHALADSIHRGSDELQRKRIELYERIKAIQDRLDSLSTGPDDTSDH